MTTIKNKTLNNKRKVSTYKRSTPEIKKEFIEFMFANTDAIKGLNASKSTDKLMELFTKKTKHEISRSWVLRLFRCELSRQLYPDGRIVYSTNGTITFENLISAKKTKD